MRQEQKGNSAGVLAQTTTSRAVKAGEQRQDGTTKDRKNIIAESKEGISMTEEKKKRHDGNKRTREQEDTI